MIPERFSFFDGDSLREYRCQRLWFAKETMLVRGEPPLRVRDDDSHGEVLMRPRWTGDVLTPSPSRWPLVVNVFIEAESGKAVILARGEIQ